MSNHMDFGPFRDALMDAGHMKDRLNAIENFHISKQARALWRISYHNI